jgi:hypothetical protein
MTKPRLAVGWLYGICHSVGSQMMKVAKKNTGFAAGNAGDSREENNSSTELSVGGSP